MKKSIINICIACDNNYAKYAGVVIASVLANAKESDFLNIYILDGGIKESLKEDLNKLKNIKDCYIDFIPINEDLFKDYKAVKTHKYISIATFYRLKLPTLLPSIDKVIYFDCDFIVNSSLNELFNIDMEGYPIAGVLDNKRKMVKRNPTYINAGMLIFDINKMKELNLEEKFLLWAKQNLPQITCGDQEIINEVCKNNIKIIDEEWNVQSSNFTNRSSYIKKPKGIHFVSKKKPWRFASYSYHKGLYFKYLQLTPWALKGFQKFLWRELNEISSLISYFFYRPLFLFRPKFYLAVYYTYIKPLTKGE